MLALDENIGDGALARDLEQSSLQLVTIGAQVELFDVERDLLVVQQPLGRGRVAAPRLGEDHCERVSMLYPVLARLADKATLKRGEGW